MKKILKWSAIGIVALILGYFVSVSLVDAYLMGIATPKYAYSVDKKRFLIEDSVRIDSQTGFKCSAYSSAFLLRHWSDETHGDCIYEIMPDKMDNGYVYPKGILSFLKSNGFTVGYHFGNLKALKNEIANGHPVIVMIKIRPDKEWLHYVPVIGYSADSVFIAESIPELCNTEGEVYNRAISTMDFETLWNTRSLKMPLYGNTFITAYRNQ